LTPYFFVRFGAVNEDFERREKLERQVFTIKKAGALFGVSGVTIWRALCRGAIKAIKGFGITRISKAELDRFIGRLRRSPKVLSRIEVSRDPYGHPQEFLLFRQLTQNIFSPPSGYNRLK
jgi:Helix-turn-helix domain